MLHRHQTPHPLLPIRHFFSLLFTFPHHHLLRFLPFSSQTTVLDVYLSRTFRRRFPFLTPSSQPGCNTMRIAAASLFLRCPRLMHIAAACSPVPTSFTSRLASTSRVSVRLHNSSVLQASEFRGSRLCAATTASLSFDRRWSSRFGSGSCFPVAVASTPSSTPSTVLPVQGARMASTHGTVLSLSLDCSAPLG